LTPLTVSDSTLSLRDRCEAVTSAPHLLSALLARSSEFGSRLTNMLLAKPVDVPAEVVAVFDEQYVGDVLGVDLADH